MCVTDMAQYQTSSDRHQKTGVVSFRRCMRPPLSRRNTAVSSALTALCVVISCLLLLNPLHVDATVDKTTLHVVGVMTAADNVLAVTLEGSSDEAAPSQTASLWSVNGVQPSQVGRFSRTWSQDIDDSNIITMRHTYYVELALGSKLVEGTEYVILGPSGIAKTTTFNEGITLCESIHANQVGYFESSKMRFANFGIFLGDLGSRNVSDGAPSYSVLDGEGRSVAGPHTSAYLGHDNARLLSSGEHVYRLDLNDVPAGGPYRIVVHGYGASHPFGVGSNHTDVIWYTLSRGLYHKRCGMALDAAHTHWARCSCHNIVLVTDAEPGQFVTEDSCLGGCSKSPARAMAGGFHDAGDFDRGAAHTLFPAMMLETYELFRGEMPAYAFDIRESDNNIPDHLDQALWGVLYWENLQEDDGGVRAGTETERHPILPDNAATDRLTFRTFRRSWHTTACGAAIFAHASRLVREFDSPRADALMERALRAWLWLAGNTRERTSTTHMYAALQLYLTTGDDAYRRVFDDCVKEVEEHGVWPLTYYALEMSITGRCMYSPYFFGYLTTSLPTTQSVKDILLGWIDREANRVIQSLPLAPYAMGPIANVAWGSTVNAAYVANPLLLKYLLTGDEDYFNQMAALSQYALGVNPLGRSFVSGLGATPPNDILDLDSFSQIRAGKSAVPGILIFGAIANPEDYDYEKIIWSKVYPDYHSLPDLRRFSDGHTLVTANEFNSINTMHASMLYTALSIIDRRIAHTRANNSTTNSANTTDAFHGTTQYPESYSWRDSVPPLTHPLVVVLGLDVCPAPVNAYVPAGLLFNGRPGATLIPGCSEYLTLVEGALASGLGEPAMIDLLRLEPDTWHAPSFSLYCGDKERPDLSGYANLNVRIRLADAKGVPVTSYRVALSAYLGSTNWIDLVDFLVDDNGTALAPDKQGAIGGEWVRARVPMSLLRTPAYDACAVERIMFDVLPSGQFFYVSEITLDGDGTPPARLVEVVTSSDRSISLVYDSYGQAEPPSQDANDYRIDGVAPSSVGRFSVSRGQQVRDCDRLTVRHHIYLVLPGNASFISGKTYVVQALTRHGPSEYSLAFDEANVRCECIKTNQVGYSSVTGARRYAVIGVWNGHLGSRKFDSLPSYRVVRLSDGAVVHTGVANEPIDDTKLSFGSGEHAYAMDLSGVPDGGPYKIVVKGVGSSYEFSVGAETSRHISYVELRGLYHQRCGCALPRRYTEYPREICHELANVTDAEFDGGFITETGLERIDVEGSWHDAGDFDRSFAHMFISESLIVMYEAYSHVFHDAVSDIPESGNGVPDILDEAMYGVLYWEHMQAEDGGVRAGTETSGHPAYGKVMASNDTLVYRTFARHWHSTIVSAGLFAHSSRLMRPYNPDKADTLLSRALRAWKWAEEYVSTEKKAGPHMYACLQLYISTGDDSFHKCFITEVDRVENGQLGYPQGFRPDYWNTDTMRQGQIFMDYFYDYLLLNHTGVTRYNTSAAPGARDTRPFPVDAATHKILRKWLGDKATEYASVSKSHAYPLGAPPNVGWGSVTAQGVFAETLLLEHRLTGDIELVAIAESLADYSLGLNPLGKSYTTGLGVDTPVTPLHCDSYFSEERGKGPIPGLTLYGPFSSAANIEYQARVWRKTYPNWYLLAEQRRFAEGWAFVDSNEFTTTWPMAPNAVMYATLAGLSGSADRVARSVDTTPANTFVYNPFHRAAFACTDGVCLVGAYIEGRWSRSWTAISNPDISVIDGVRVRDGVAIGRNASGVAFKSVDGGGVWTQIAEQERLDAFEDGFKPSRVLYPDAAAASDAPIHTLNDIAEGSIDGPFSVTSRGVYAFDEATGNAKMLALWKCVSSEVTCHR
eukprot:Opistho-2@44623